jgi:hypothetical protein
MIVGYRFSGAIARRRTASAAATPSKDGIVLVPASGRPVGAPNTPPPSSATAASDETPASADAVKPARK